MLGGEGGKPAGWSGGKSPGVAPAEGAQGLAELITLVTTNMARTRRLVERGGLGAIRTFVHADHYDGRQEAMGRLFPPAPSQRNDGHQDKWPGMLEIPWVPLI